MKLKMYPRITASSIKYSKKEIKYTNRSENNFLENNPENVNKVNQELFQSKNKNRYPIFDKGIQDITSNNTKNCIKQIYTFTAKIEIQL